MNPLIPYWDGRRTSRSAFTPIYEWIVINLDMFPPRPISQAVVRVVDALGKIVYTQVLSQPSGGCIPLTLAAFKQIYLMNVGNAEFSKTVRVSVSVDFSELP